MESSFGCYTLLSFFEGAKNKFQILNLPFQKSLTNARDY